MSFASAWARKTRPKLPEPLAKMANNPAHGIFGHIGHAIPESENNTQSLFGHFGQAIPNSEKHTGTPALEILDLAERGIVTLHTDGRGGLWWTAPSYQEDPGSLCWLSDLWGESWPDLFRLLEAGGLDHLLPKRTNSTTQAPPLERPRRRRITPAMLERFRRARPWITAHMPALLAQGWTRRTLYRAGRHPHPLGQWGLAWSAGWTAPHLARVELGPDGVAFVLDEPHRTVTQTARPNP